MEKEEVKAKIKNMYIMLLYAITKEDIGRVKQYLSDDLFKEYEKKINENIANDVVQKYGELNVARVDILSEEENIINAQILVKYIDYTIDRNTREFKDGEKTRSERIVNLKVRYQGNNREIVYICSKCGAVLNVNLTSVCYYCGVPVSNEESLYVIESIK